MESQKTALESLAIRRLCNRLQHLHFYLRLNALLTRPASQILYTLQLGARRLKRGNNHIVIGQQLQHTAASSSSTLHASSAITCTLPSPLTVSIPLLTAKRGRSSGRTFLRRTEKLRLRARILIDSDNTRFERRQHRHMVRQNANAAAECRHIDLFDTLRVVVALKERQEFLSSHKILFVAPSLVTQTSMACPSPSHTFCAATHERTGAATARRVNSTTPFACCRDRLTIFSFSLSSTANFSPHAKVRRKAYCVRARST